MENTSVPQHKAFRDLLERVYMAAESRDTPRGAVAWFRRALVKGQPEEFRTPPARLTIDRWVRGVHPIPGAAWTVLRHIEREVAARAALDGDT